MEIKTFGPVDERSLAQLKRCMEAGDADFGVLCADHHPGYSQPIGGGIAYEGHISPSGVGYDIGCIAEGTPVRVDSRAIQPIEEVAADSGALCWDGHCIREISPCLGAVSRGKKPVVQVRLANRSSLVSTPDHLIRGRRGWCRADGLVSGEQVACELSGEIAWVEVEGIDDAGSARVYDVATADPAESFLAEGVVVHNCGNKAVQTNLTREEIDVPRVMEEIGRRISFGMGVPAQEEADHPVLEKIEDAEFEPQRRLAGLARKQLGTVGSGNHYVNVFEDEHSTVWVGVHFGSRGFGHKTASGFLALAQGLSFDAKAHEGEMDSPPVLLDIDTELGQSYIEAMNLALEYAYAGRDTVVDKVLEILGAEPVHEVHNNHNYAALETHHGRDYWVVRKGCTPAFDGQEGFVGGSMGDDSVVLEGVEGEEAKQSLYSTVHGAGRVMSRTQAAGRVRRKTVYACSVRDCPWEMPAKQYDGEQCPSHPESKVRRLKKEEQVRPGLVDWDAVRARLREQGIVLLGGGADEAPEVYKRLPEVLDAHAGSIRVKHTLRPLGVAMAGRDVFDPYKD